ncbi:MAG: hypothetical protein AAF215_24265 [Cyanobacteria bacterium P01_A01_bin.123]
MGIRTKRVIGTIGAAIAASLAFSTVANAQQAPRTGAQTIPEAVDEILSSNSGTYFENRTLWRQFSFIAGPGFFGNAAFPELESERDAEAIALVTRYLLAEQSVRDPYLRVPDLRNPYDSSMQLLPTTQSGSRVVGSELIFERLPLP